MSYNSPLIVSTSSLNPSFGVVALWKSPVVAVCAGLALAVNFVIAIPIAVWVAVAITVVVVVINCVFKAAYVRPEACLE